MKQSKMYGTFAHIYDAAYHFVDYETFSDYLVRNIRLQHPDAQSLLEVACGTGRYLELLAEHFDVEGLDLTEEMLEKARERLPHMPLHLGDMTNFSLSGRYDVVCCLFRSIAYAKTQGKLFSTVQAMSNHLKPGGLLVIEPFFTPDTYWADKVTLNEYKSDALKISWMYVTEKIDAIARLRYNVLVGTPAGVNHFVETHELGLFSRDDFEEAFTRAGLSLEYDPVGPTGIGLYFGRKLSNEFNCDLP